MIGGNQDAHNALQRFLLSRLEPASVKIECDSRTPWSSATFSGYHHHFDMTITGQDALTATARLGRLVDGEEVRIKGHLIADIQLSSHQLIQQAQDPVVVIGVDALTVKSA